MELHATFKTDGCDVGAHFGAIERLTEADRKVYEQQMAELESHIEELNDDKKSLMSEITGLKIKALLLEREKKEEYLKGIEAGKEVAYDQFWDLYQDNGKRVDYSKAFAGLGWTEESFKPKYSLNGITSASRMFDGTGISNLTSAMIAMEKYLDLEGTLRTDYMFNQCNVVRVPPLDLRTVTNMEYMFYRAEKLEIIDCLTFADDGSQELGSRFFYRCEALKTLNVMGQLGCDVDIRYSPLNHYSIVGLVEHLSPTATGKTVTFSKTHVNKQYETSKDAKNGTTSEAWRAIVALRPNWTITVA